MLSIYRWWHCLGTLLVVVFCTWQGGQADGVFGAVLAGLLSLFVIGMLWSGSSSGDPAAARRRPRNAASVARAARIRWEAKARL